MNEDILNLYWPDRTAEDMPVIEAWYAAYYGDFDDPAVISALDYGDYYYDDYTNPCGESEVLQPVDVANASVWVGSPTDLAQSVDAPDLDNFMYLPGDSGETYHDLVLELPGITFKPDRITVRILADSSSSTSASGNLGVIGVWDANEIGDFSVIGVSEDANLLAIDPGILNGAGVEVGTPIADPTIYTWHLLNNPEWAGGDLSTLYLHIRGIVGISDPITQLRIYAVEVTCETFVCPVCPEPDPYPGTGLTIDDLEEVSVSATGDDGYYYPAGLPIGGTDFVSNSTELRFGVDQGNAYAYTELTTFLTFRNVAIPFGNVVENAFVTFVAYAPVSGSEANKMSLRITAHCAGDSTPPTTRAEALAMERHHTRIEWQVGSTPWVDETSYETPDIGPLLTEIVNHPDWVSGNDITLFFENDGSAWYRPIHSFDSTTEDAPKLSVWHREPYTPPDEPEHDTSITSDAAGSFGNERFGGELYYQGSIYSQWITYDPGDGDDMRVYGYVHIPEVSFPAEATDLTVTLGIYRTNPAYVSVTGDYYPGDWHGEKTADPIAISSRVDGLSRITDLTTAFVKYPTADHPGDAYDYIDVTAIFEELRDSGGWVDGNDIQLFFINKLYPTGQSTGTDQDYWFISQGGLGTDTPVGMDAAPPKLFLNYTIPAQEAAGDLTCTGTMTGAAVQTHAAAVALTATATVAGEPYGDPLLTSLVSYWPCNEASGNALDAHGTNHLTDNNTVAAATGKISGGRDYERDNSESHSIASNSTLQVADIPFTLTCWVKLESKPAGNQNIVGKWGTSAGEYILNWDASIDRFRFNVNDGGGLHTVTASTFGAPSTGVWYFLIAYHDPATNVIGISVNNGTTDTLSHSTGVATGTNDFRLGWAGNAGAGYTDGVIDEVGFWKRLLTAGEKTRLYRSGSGLPYPFADKVGAVDLTATSTLTGNAVATYLTAGDILGITANATATGMALGAYEVGASLSVTAEMTGAAEVSRPVAGNLTCTATLDPATVEHFYGGRAALTSTATMTGAAEVSLGGAVAMTASATMADSGSYKGKNAIAAITSTATLAGDTIAVVNAGVPLTCTATLSGSPVVESIAAGSCTASATLAGAHNFVQEASGAITSTATLAGDTDRTTRATGVLTASATLAGAANLTATAAGSCTASGVLTAAASRGQEASGDFTASAALTASTRARYRPTVAMSVSGSMAPASTPVEFAGAAALSASVTVDGAASRPDESAGVLTCTASLTGNAVVTNVASGVLTATATVAAAASRGQSAAATLTATATTSSTGSRGQRIAGSLTASAFVNLNAYLDGVASGSCTATATVAGSTTSNQTASVSLSATASLSGAYYTPLALGLATALRSDATVAGLVGTKIYPMHAPKDAALPFVIYGCTGIEPVRQLDGAAGVDNTTYEISAFAETRAEAKAICRAIRAAIVGYRGLWLSAEILTVEATDESYGDNLDGTYVEAANFSIWNRQPIANLTGAGLTSTEDFGESIVSYLSSLAPVYPSFSDIDAPTPAIHYEIAERPIEQTDGESGINEVSLDLVIRAATYRQAVELAYAVRMKLDGLSGTVEGTGAYCIWFDSQSDEIDRPDSDGDNPTFIVQQDYLTIIDAQN